MSDCAIEEERKTEPEDESLENLLSYEKQPPNPSNWGSLLTLELGGPMTKPGPMEAVNVRSLLSSLKDTLDDTTQRLEPNSINQKPTPAPLSPRDTRRKMFGKEMTEDPRKEILLERRINSWSNSKMLKKGANHDQDVC